MNSRAIHITLPPLIADALAAEAKRYSQTVSQVIAELAKKSGLVDAHIKSTTVVDDKTPQQRRRERALTPGQIADLELYRGRDGKTRPDRLTWEKYYASLSFDLSQKFISEEDFQNWMAAAKCRRDEWYARAPLEPKPFLHGYDDRCEHGMMYPEEPCYDCDVANGKV